MKKLFILFTLSFLWVQNALAQVHLDQSYLGEGADALVKPETNTAENMFNELVLHIADIVIYFAASVAVLALVVGAAHLLQAGANEEAAGKAKVTIMWSIIGLFTVIFSYALVRSVIYLIFTTLD